MAKSKQKTATNGQQQHRAETKKEKLLRMKHQEEARQECLKLLPYVGGIILMITICFMMWVRTVPPVVESPLLTDDISGEQMIYKEQLDDMLADMGASEKFDDLTPEDREAAIQAFFQLKQQQQQQQKEERLAAEAAARVRSQQNMMMNEDNNVMEEMYEL